MESQDGLTRRCSRRVDKVMKLSVIIPSLNEEENIQKCIESVQQTFHGSPFDPIEIIVVDGGSNDRTEEFAIKAGARFIKSKRGRGIQLKNGASSAQGDLLMFLHADSRLFFNEEERKNISRIISEILKGNYAGGFFRLRFDNGSPSIKLVELFANLRAKLFSLPYGDQAIFIRKDVYEKIGGFKEYPFLEDIDIVLKLKREGHRLKYIDIPVTASSRRLKKGYPLSPIIVSLRNVIIAMLFIIGVKPSSLIKVYN